VYNVLFPRSGPATRAISDQRVAVSISDAEVRALLIGAGEALGLHPLGGSPPAFHLTPGAGLIPEEQRRQRGQSSGVRGLSRRWTSVRLLAAGEWED
jgi:hypothetical protein